MRDKCYVTSVAGQEIAVTTSIAFGSRVYLNGVLQHQEEQEDRLRIGYGHEPSFSFPIESKTVNVFLTSKMWTVEVQVFVDDEKVELEPITPGYISKNKFNLTLSFERFSAVDWIVFIADMAFLILGCWLLFKGDLTDGVFFIILSVLGLPFVLKMKS